MITWVKQLICSHWDLTEISKPSMQAPTPYGWHERTRYCNLCGKAWYKYVDEQE